MNALAKDFMSDVARGVTTRFLDQQTVPQALVCALTATDFEDAIRNAISIGGDSDTVAAIAGGLAEARFGIPEDLAAAGWAYVPQDMRHTLTLLYEKAGVAL